jgi:lysozyme
MLSVNPILIFTPGVVKKKKKHILLWLGIFLFLFILYALGVLQLNYPDSLRYPVRGIDISHYQHKINWKKLQSENIDFIFIKATEGVKYKDDKFNLYWKKARENNYCVGAYHFYLACKPGIPQADNFISAVPYQDNSLPPVIDLEHEGSCWDKKLTKDIVSEIHIFLKKLEKKYKKKPIIYTTNRIYNRFVKGTKLESYPVWIRSIYQTPRLNDNHWQFWQYSSRGKIKGIDGHTDLNVFNGSRKEFYKLCKK